MFGFLAGSIIDRFGVRRLMLAGIVMAGLALVGLASVTTLAGFYLFYFLNALGYVCGGPLPAQVLLTRWFSDARGRAMGVAYLGIGVGGALVPILAHALVVTFGWRGALRYLGILMIVVAFPPAFFVREPPRLQATEIPDIQQRRSAQQTPAAFGQPSAHRPSAHRRDDAEPEAVFEPGSPSLAGRDCRHPLADSDRQPRRARHDGVARRPMAEEARHGARLRHRRLVDPAAGPVVDAVDAPALRIRVRHRARR